MAQSRKTIESVWAAKGNLPDSAIVATSDGKYPALDGSLITGIAGSGDMNASVYDPTTIQADAFARANHTGTQTASTISDFDTEVSNNTTVAANATNIALKAPINNPAFTGSGTIGSYNILTDQLIGLDIQAHSSTLDATTASFTTAKDAEIAANTLKVTYPSADSTKLAGYSPIAIITDATTARSLALTDIGGYIRLTNAASCTITVPANATVDWASETEPPTIYFRVAAAGVPTLSNAGVTVNDTLGVVAALEAGSTFALQWVASDVWDII
jgi:hypothetical protein